MIPYPKIDAIDAFDPIANAKAPEKELVKDVSQG
jgi:hypothetical protein